MGDLFFFNIADRTVSPKVLRYGLARVSDYLYAIIQSKEENFIRIL